MAGRAADLERATAEVRSEGGGGGRKGEKFKTRRGYESNRGHSSP